MARDEAPPFARGETYYNGETIDSSNLGGVNLEGKEYTFEVNAPDDPSGTDTSGRPVRVRVVRNVSGGALKPARVGVFKAADPYETQVDGYVAAVGDRPAGVVDEFLPAAGVPNNDLFYLVIDGPTKVTTPGSGQSNLAIGDRIVPATGTSKTNDDAGRVVKQAEATIADGTTTVAAFNNLQNVIGFAGEANNTTDTKIKAVVHRAYR